MVGGVLRFVPGDREAECVVAADQVGADVGGHDDDRVAEVHAAALGVGQVAVVEDLQQHVEDLRVRLLDLVQQDQAVRLAAHGVRQLAGVVVADVARRSADETRDVVLLHELRHVELDHGFFAAEHELGQHARQVRLADAGGAEEHEHADRPARVLQAGAGAADGLGDAVDRLVLADDLLVQDVFHVQQALRLFGGDARDRNARPHRDDFADVLGGDLGGLFLLLFLPAGLHALQLVLELDLAVAQLGGVLVLLVLDRLFLLAAEAVQALRGFLQRRRRVRALDPHAGGGLVDEVDRLVRQEAVRHVARGQLSGGLQRFVRDRQAVVLLVAGAHALQDQRWCPRWTAR